MKKNTLILLMFSFLLASTTTHAQFLKKLSLEELARLDEENNVEIEEFGFSAGNLPSSASLEKYAIVSNQGRSNSCVGFALSSAFNILYNQVNNIDRFTEKIAHRFDPYYIYAGIKVSNDEYCDMSSPCACLTMITDAFELVKTYGCKKWFVSPILECDDIKSSADLRNMYNITGHYKIDDYTNLLSYEKRNNEWGVYYNPDHFKWMISNGNPILAGLSIGTTFYELSSMYTAPTKENYEGGHAVLVVGYDDNYKGGSFRVLNSYGSSWGDNGFFWITYKDFYTYIDQAHTILIDDFSSWTSTIDKSNFYKGKLTDGDFWEGPMNSSRSLQGGGILVGEDFTAAAEYENGLPNGWWLYFSDDMSKFSGRVFFVDGEVESQESFGFSANETKNLFHLDNADIDINEEIGTEEDIDIDIIDKSTSKSKSSKFNFNKKNNYSKD